MEQREGFLERLASTTFYRAASALGLLVALITAPLALPPVQSALFRNEAHLTFQLVSTTPVIDVDRRFPGISVSYQGQNLLERRQDLTLVRARLINDGETSISESAVSESDPVTARLTAGKIVGVISSSASSDHLRRLGRPFVDGRVISYPTKVIFEKGDQITTEFLVIKPTRRPVSFSVTGKLLGSLNIGYASTSDKSGQTFIDTIFAGSIWVHVARLFIYTLFSILLLAALILIVNQIDKVQEGTRRWRREKIASQARKTHPAIGSDVWMLVACTYSQYGDTGLDAIEHKRAPPKRVSQLRNAQSDVEPPSKKDGENRLKYIRRALRTSQPLYSLYGYIRKVAANVGTDLNDERAEHEFTDAVRKLRETAGQLAEEMGYDGHKVASPHDFITESMMLEVADISRMERRVSSVKDQEGRHDSGQTGATL